jgi:predicted permease
MTPFWNGLDDPKDYWIQLVGRLKPGISLEQAQTALLATYRPLLRALEPQMIGWDEVRRRQFESRRILLAPGGRGRAVLRRGVGTPLLYLAAMLAIVLLIACSNLAGLLAARGAARQREYGIRLAIGASRSHLVRQSMIECLFFAVGGGALGLLVAAWTLHALLGAFPPDADVRQLAAHIDPRVLAFAAMTSLVAGLLFGVTPALRAARLDPARTLRGGGRGGASAGSEILRLRRWLVTGQVALTLVLLVAAGLFVQTLRNLGRVELGLKPDHVIGFSIAPKLNGYTAERAALFARTLTERLSALPGVRSVTAAEVPTLANDQWGGNVFVEGSDPESRSEHVGRNAVAPDYFATLGIPLVSGRELTWQDDRAAPRVAVINETLARRFFGRRNPLGARIGFFADKLRPDVEIVGVVRNSKGSDVMEADRPFVYTPYLQDPKLGELTFYLRSRETPDRLAPAIRSEVRRLDGALPIFNLKTLRGQIEESLVTQRLLVLLSAAFGGLAALLAALGVYGVLAFAVEQRRQEIGVRIALGAGPGSVRRLILSEVGGFLLVGGAIGVPASM